MCDVNASTGEWMNERKTDGETSRRNEVDCSEEKKKKKTAENVWQTLSSWHFHGDINLTIKISSRFIC